jgi:hypothetical protein
VVLTLQFALRAQRCSKGVTDPFLRQDMTKLSRGREEGLIIRTDRPLLLNAGVERTFLHSCAQRLGLQRLSSTIAIRVILSAMMTGERTRTMFDDERPRNLDSTRTYLCPKIEIGAGQHANTTWLPSWANTRLSDDPINVTAALHSPLQKQSGVSLSP